MQNMGWICPRCGTSNAPFIRSCEGCAPKTAVPLTVESIDAKSAGDRLAAARAAKGFDSATAAACAHQWNVNTYRSAENGTRGIKAAKAKMYAKAFGVDPIWILFGDDDELGEPDGKMTIRQARRAKGMTQATLARKLNVSVQAISQWEVGKHLPDTGNLLTLCALLDVQAEGLQIGRQLYSENIEFDQEGIRRRLTERLATLGKSARGASEEAGLGASTIRNIMDGSSKSPRLGTLMRIAKVLAVDVEWFMESAVQRVSDGASA